MLIVTYMDTGVQDYFHFKGCSCRLTVTGRVPLVEQKLQTSSEIEFLPPLLWYVLERIQCKYNSITSKR